LHKPLAPSIAELFEAINETFKRGGNVIIPTFAVERALIDRRVLAGPQPQRPQLRRRSSITSTSRGWLTGQW